MYGCIPVLATDFLYEVGREEGGGQGGGAGGGPGGSWLDSC
jgi:hypothetical protein